MKRFSREIALLTLPVVLLGGIAWWKTRGGSMAQLRGAPSDIYSGAPRLEIGEIKPLEMTQWDVAQGFVWGIDAAVWQGGESPVAPGVKASGGSSWVESSVFYRRGAHWSKAEAPDKLTIVRHISGQWTPFGEFASRRDQQVKVRLNGVPRDAEEVRLRGTFFDQQMYRGPGCRGVSGEGWKTYGAGACTFKMKTKSFYVPIVKTKGAWPNPQVSRETNLEFVDAKWIVDGNLGEFILLVRRKDGTEWKNKSLASQNVQIFDDDNRPIELFDSRNKGKFTVLSMGSYAQERFNSQRDKSELYAPVVWVDSVAPKQGWDSVKFPLTLRAQVSDGTNWPLQIDTKVERVQMRTEDFGAEK